MLIQLLFVMLAAVNIAAYFFNVERQSPRGSPRLANF